MSKNQGYPTQKGKIEIGDIRLIHGVKSVIMEEPDRDGPPFVYSACPVKESENKSGNVVLIGDGKYAALAELTGSVYPEFIGEKVDSISAEDAYRVLVAHRSIYRKPGEGTDPFDRHATNTPEDWDLYHKMICWSQERFLALYADTYVFEGESPDDPPRRETKKERRSRLQRRRRELKKLGIPLGR